MDTLYLNANLIPTGTSNGYELSANVYQRLVDAYFHSVATANYLRAMITGGVSDLSAAADWRLENVLSPQVG